MPMTELSGLELLCNLSVVRCAALIGCTLGVVRESLGGMSVYVLLPLVPVYMLIPYRAVRWQYCMGSCPVAYRTVRVY